jgi:hypothetical protein
MRSNLTSDGIHIRILGDYGPFSTMGKSIGYQVTIGDSSFLVDCGSPLFQQIRGHGLKSIKGLIVTHCHDDHKRWFTDLALFNMYAPDVFGKVNLLTSEKVNDGLMMSSGPALDTSLAADSKRVVDLHYDDYIDLRLLGPRAKYRIAQREVGNGIYSPVVIDSTGAVVGPERAKVVISARNGKARLLFKDPVYQEWVEPETFYPFAATTFYAEEQNVYRDPAGFTIEAINASVWHGLPAIGIRFRTANETLVFSSDTAHDRELWQSLCEEKREQRLPGSREEFERSSILHGDINDFIERTWSQERYQEALTVFDNAVVIHDIATRKTAVHTDYRRLAQTVLAKERTILTHSPDNMTSEWAISEAGKTFVVVGERFFEKVGDQLWPLDADIYHKEAGRFFVGYRNPHGTGTVYENDSIINLGGEFVWEKGTLLYLVDLYEDVGGKYFPKLPDDGSKYMERPDGRVERVRFTAEGSTGTVVEDQRGTLSTAL